MKLDIKPILKKLRPFINFLKRDSVGIFLAIVAVIFGFLIWRIGNLAGAEPSSDAMSEKLTSVVRPKIDPASIKKIEDLQAQNIDIQSYISDRNNPFQE
ncbi:hypothetical protein BH10PAT3_BH10PAT3_0970 [soil metagenome]